VVPVDGEVQALAHRLEPDRRGRGRRPPCEGDSVLDQAPARRRGGRGLNEGESSRSRGAPAVQRAAGWGSDAGTALWECREVSWDQENTLAQTDASATGGGSPSLIADAWRTRISGQDQGEEK
jgi:hypothetical protein